MPLFGWLIAMSANRAARSVRSRLSSKVENATICRGV